MRDALQIIVWGLPLLAALTVHEVAHGLVAYWLGDDTAERAGRLSLNPLRHLHPIGSVLIPAALVLAHLGWVAGWAKPLPVDSRRLRHPVQDWAWIAAAGPLANLSMASAWRLLEMAPYCAQLAHAGVVVNLGMAIFNLLPFPPFDGARIAAAMRQSHA